MAARGLLCLGWLLLAACGPSPPSPERQQELRQRLAAAPLGAAEAARLEVAVAAGEAGAAGCGALAGHHFASRNYARALALYREALEREPGQARSHYNLGLLLQRLGRSEEAIQHLQLALDLEPFFADAHLGLGAAYAQRVPEASVQGQTEQMRADLQRAAHHCSTAVALEPGNPQFHHSLGRVRQLRREYGAAVESYRRAVALDSTLVDAFRQQGRAHAQQGEWEPAAAALRRVLQLHPGDAEAHFELGNVLERARDYEGSRAAYQEAIALEPANAAAHYNLGRVYHRLGQRVESQEAMGRFERLKASGGSTVQGARIAVQRNPDGVAERRALAAVLSEAGRHQEAAEELRVALALDPRHGGIHYDLGLVHGRRGDGQQAVAALLQAVALDPDSAAYHLRLGQAYAQLDQQGPAVAAVERAVALEPAWPRARRELARLYLRGGDCGRAGPHLEWLTRAQLEDRESRMELAICRSLAGRREEAIALMEAVVAATPGDGRARALLDRLRRGRL